MPYQCLENQHEKNCVNETTPLLNTHRKSLISSFYKSLCKYYHYMIYLIGWGSLLLSHMSLIFSRNLDMSGSFDIIGASCLFFYAFLTYDCIIATFMVLWLIIGILEIKKN